MTIGKHRKEHTIDSKISIKEENKIRNIEFYCGPDFDPRIGQELTAAQYYLRKIQAAKETKVIVDLSEPLDGIRSNKIAEAIDDWQAQFDEIFERTDA